MNQQINVNFEKNLSVKIIHPTMKVYQSIRGYFIKLGFRSGQFVQKDSINMECLFSWLLLIYASISMYAFILLEAQVFEEYANSFIMALTYSVLVFDLGICIWKMQSVFQFMNNFDVFIEKSE